MVLAVAVMLTVTGCVTARVAPPGPSGAETARYLQVRVDLAWKNSGLEGIVDRPAVSPVVRPVDTSGVDLMGQCLLDSGSDGFAWSDGLDGVELVSIDGKALTTQMELDFYSCFAANPTALGARTPMLSAAQLDFLYDYYQELVVPCLAAFGIAGLDVPSRETYRADPFGHWTPYEAMAFSDSVLRGRAIERCGDPHAGILPERTPLGYSTAQFQND